MISKQLDGSLSMFVCSSGFELVISKQLDGSLSMFVCSTGFELVIPTQLDWSSSPLLLYRALVLQVLF